MFGSLYLENAVICLRIALYTYYAIGVDIWLTHTFHQPQPLYKILPCHFRDSSLGHTVVQSRRQALGRVEILLYLSVR